MLILIIAEQALNGLLCCSNKCDSFKCRHIGKLYISTVNTPDKCVWNKFNFTWTVVDYHEIGPGYRFT